MSSPAHVQTTHRGNVFSVEVLEVRDADGEIHRRDVVRHPGAVLVLPLLESGQKVVMIRNYRVAVDDWLWELPAGKLEPGEQPAAAAGRELEEEVGYRAGRLWKLGEFHTSPGFTDELMRVFVAEELAPSRQRLEPGEQIEVEVVAVREAMAMALDGRLRDGKSIAALLMWRQSHAPDRHREQRGAT